MIELLKQFDFSDGVIAVCFLSLVFFVWFRLYWTRNNGEFVEFTYMPKYRLKNKTWFYGGGLPTINHTQINSPDILITRCMILTLISQNETYYQFEIYCNYCKTEGEYRRHEQLVYYKKELFDNLDKKEL